MTGTTERSRPRVGLAPAEWRQSRYWDRRYRADPTFFGAGRSAFLGWLLAAVRDRPVGRTWLELGSGYGRDLRVLRREGYRVRGIDVSSVGTAIARKRGLAAARADALSFLRAQSPRSFDVVFSNLFYNMEFTAADHERLFSLVYRVLVPGGYHTYSVRSVSDPWFGKGTKVGPATYDLGPDGPVMHFFSNAYARRLRRGRFRSVRSWEGDEDQGDFPIRVLYMLDRKSRG